ncbi:MAG: hypothetical protein WAN50_04000 [Minisyncoccia bacterium]
MSRTSALILLGILVALTPFSGLPIAIRNLLAVIFGICVTSIGVSLRAHEVRTKQQAVESTVPVMTAEPVSEPTPPTGVSPI